MIFTFYGHLDYLHLEISIIGKHVLLQSPGASYVTDEKLN